MSSSPAVDLAAPDRERQSELSFDPFHLMPAAIPPHPRVLVTPAQLQRLRVLTNEAAWARACHEELIAAARGEPALAEKADKPSDGAILARAEHNALAFHITGDGAFFTRAAASYRRLAQGYVERPLSGTDQHAFGGGLGEGHENIYLGQTYDLLAAGPLGAEDDRLFRQMLTMALAISNNNPHRTCGNHNTWCTAGRLSVASALGDRRAIHDVLYGCPCPAIPTSPDTPTWRYGFAHQLRHDFLADGLHWERTPGYHMYTLMAVVDMAAMFEHLCVDIWRAELPALEESDGHDLHRAYGPPGTRCLKSAFDAIFYQAFTNGDLSMLHDAGLAHLRGTYVWGTVMDLVAQAYDDPKYAWLLRRREADFGEKRETPGLRMGLQNGRRLVEFARLRSAELPAGEFSFAPDARVAQTMRHVRGCSLFPTAGLAVLRSDTADARASGVYMFWGPHSAGHQCPAALHVDLHGGGARATDAPISGGYGDAAHGSWVRTTIAHNTVTVDRRPMFPYDLGGDSIWEADSWRRRESDGELMLFQPEEGFHALRAANQNVYPGVRLDRTVVLTREYVLDVFRVFADQEHTYDWAMHVMGKVGPVETAPAELGGGPGYGHLKNAREVRGGRDVRLAWARDRGGATRAQIWVPQGGRVFLADDPCGGDHVLGDLGGSRERSSVIVRSGLAHTLFVSLWRFDEREDGAAITAVEGEARQAVGVVVASGGRSRCWALPIQQGKVRWL